MTEIELINEIFEKSNAFAVMTGLHTANVAYIPKKYSHLCLSKSWEQVNGKLILMNAITIFFKPFENDNIFVNYMKEPSDEMISYPQPSKETKQRSFLKIGTSRIDVADIVSYHTKGRDQLYINLRYKNDSILIYESPENIRNAVEILDRYFDAKIVL